MHIDRREEPLVLAGSFEERLQEVLIATNACKALDIAQARQVRAQQPGNEPLVSLLVRLGMVSERVMADTLAQITPFRLMKPSDYAVTASLAVRLPPRFLKDQIIVPLPREDGSVDLVMTDPTLEYPVRAISMALGVDVSPCIGVASEIQHAIEQLLKESGQEEPGSGEPRIAFDMDVDHLRDMASEAPVIRLVNQMIQRAVDSRASDIHIEPFESLLKIRYRVDGVLRDEMSPSSQMAPAIISRVKIMARLDIAERRLPQDGRINLRIQGQNLDIRVSTVPTMFGESVVMRLLHRESVELNFDYLGFNVQQKQLVASGLEMSHGMIIVTGPTGSGKTTTLYAALKGINAVQRKIITVEDPIEYNIEGINQIQVNPAIGLNFADTLRSIVRQDPDVIMVGEMRDLETAKMCVQSALTGHLVLSTLHTNDSASSITRLLEMGIEDYLLASTLTTVLSQRLVRKLCLHCRQPYQASDVQIREFGLGRLRPDGPFELFRAVGCEECGGSGYRGRIGIVEILAISEKIRPLILEHSSATRIEQVARTEGMNTMFEDGCIKALDGITTLEDVLRVTKEA